MLVLVSCSDSFAVYLSSVNSPCCSTVVFTKPLRQHNELLMRRKSPNLCADVRNRQNAKDTLYDIWEF